MLNYISAELYKLRRNRLLPVGMALLLVVEATFFTPAARSKALLQSAYLDFFVVAISIGVFLAPVFAAAAYDNQGGYATLKNEVVFGIPRSRVYLGKLATGAMVGTACAAVAAGWYLLLTAALGEPALQGALAWQEVWRALACSWCAWMGSYAFAFFLMMALKNVVAALLVSYLTTSVGWIISTLVAGSRLPEWQRLLAKLFYTYPSVNTMYAWGMMDISFAVNGAEVEVALVGEALLWALPVLGLWVGASTAAGLLLFQRGEIK